ncbi:MAG: deoxynucleoside kinase, partial [Planctomycetota bacterium]
DSELFFLSSSASQLRKDKLFGGRRYVNDYVFEKAHIYASSWLKPDDLAVYEKHFDSICEGIASPVLVIYLVDSVAQCMERIRKRNRPYEQEIELSFLEHLASGYERLYTDYTVCPVLRLRPDECFTDEQVDGIAAEVKAYIAQAE